MNLNNPHQHLTDPRNNSSPSPKLGIDLAMKSTSTLSSYQATSVQPPQHLTATSVATTAAMLDSTRQFASSLRLLSNDNESPLVTPGPSVGDSSRFLIPTSSVKEEPDCEAMTQFNLSTTPEAQSTSEMSIPVDKVYPLVISEYYTNPVLFSQDMKEKVTAHCRRCGRPVTGWWAPRLVTSNFITHLKSCSMELYQHFQDTKKRCGWAARRYTVKLHANSSSPGPAWKFSSSTNISGVSQLSDQHSVSKVDERLDRSLLPVTQEVDQSCLKTNNQVLRALLTFAAQEVRSPGSLCSGSVRRLLLSLNENIEYPTEMEIRQFLSRHQPSIESLAFAQLPPLDQSVVLLSLHGQLNNDPLGSPASCVVAFWSCFILGGTLHKRLFSVCRYPDADSALLHSSSHIDSCRERHNRSSRSRKSPSSEGILVLSVDPSSYLRLPLTPYLSPGDLDVDLKALRHRLDFSKTRLLDDFCRRLWRIFTDAVEQVEGLPRLLGAVLQSASTMSVSEPHQQLVVSHLRQLSAAIEALTNPYSSILTSHAEVWRHTGDPREHRGVLDAVLNAGHYFESAIQRLHRPGVSAGSRLPLLLGLQKKFGVEASPGAADRRLVADLRRALVVGLETALAEEVADSANGETSFSLLATFADPQYKLFWVEDAEQEARYRDRIVKHLTARQPKVEESHDSAAAPSSTSTSSSPSSSADFVQESGDGLLDFVAKRRRLAISSAGCDWPIMDEVQTYLGNHEEAGPLDFWANVRHQENYPNVYKLHLEVHAVPVSCLDTSLALGLSHDLLTRVAVGKEWQTESDDVAQSLVLSKCIGYDFNN